MTKWKFGIVGSGMIADFHARAINEIPDTEIIGFCDSGSGKAKLLAEKYDTKAFTGYENLLNEPGINVVTIATPSGLHLEPTVLAAEKGIHVLCEKPIEITTERVDQMIAAHKKSNTFLGGIFNYRFTPVIKEIQNALSEGRLGKISFAGIYVPWWRDEKYYAGSWKGTKKLDGGGALMNQSIHMVDLFQHIMGPISSLCAFTDHLVHEIEAEDTGVAIVKFKNGALGHIYGTTASWPGQFRKMEITGSEGTIHLVEDSITVWDFKESKPEDQEIMKKYGETHEGGGVADPAAMTHHNHKKNIAAFLEAIENNTHFDIDGLESRKAVEIICAIYESQDKQKIINL
ncbi:MAG: Gfo/Idh/MocA family protein [Bacteroidota bacterium]